ncbi:DUF362 domain-containing protein [Carboxydocella sp. ULO1]|uniref:DUF362 domain-containing protein n=1 Tax=Carboxydocella sp. ULO1 TaxID=1926599 RepID=UPI0009ACA43A|nr:DUF362 domain-containing protein [Carboxydocella sp. ULO1]GAW28582.1 (Fe-S)-binding protein [Carboxydocella sp. ULO1]
MKVAAAVAKTYDYIEVEAGVQEVLNQFGGMETLIKPEERVLIKPNMLEGLPPERAVTTHPEVVRAVIRQVKRAGGIPLVGDSPGIGSGMKAAEKNGIAGVCREEGAELLAFAESAEYSFPEGKVIRKFHLTGELQQVDKVISLAKMKTHSFMGITGAVKNLFGCIVGPGKAQFHLRLKRRDDFAAMLVDLALLVKPVFFLVDGIVGMEGNGPRNGSPIQAGVILGGTNGFAVDLVMGQMMGFNSEELPVSRLALARGLVPGLKRIEVVGSGRELRWNFQPPYNLESLDGRVPPFLVRFFQNQFTYRPVMNEKCTGCSRCAQHCPPQAIKIENGKAMVDYEQCIRCYCCQELCPFDAVILEQGLLLKLFGRKK